MVMRIILWIEKYMGKILLILKIKIKKVVSIRIRMVKLLKGKIKELLKVRIRSVVLKIRKIRIVWSSLMLLWKGQ